MCVQYLSILEEVKAVALYCPLELRFPVRTVRVQLHVDVHALRSDPQSGEISVFVI